MSTIWVPNQKKTLAELLAHLGKGAEQLLADKVIGVVAESFQTRPGRQTGSEVKRRSQICFEWFRRLVGDHSWSCARAYDHLILALECELDGDEYVPPTSTIWMPRGTQDTWGAGDNWGETLDLNNLVETP